MKRRKLVLVICIIAMQLITVNILAQPGNNAMQDEQYRPQVHFSPKEHWINDPNGMVYYKGIYHLFFQYHPYSSVWGPMHWGHATSSDMIHWKRQPIAVYPDSIGTIFSGSAVVDKNNTSGFGKNGQVPLVAIFTQHDTIGEKAGRSNFQNQSIAYSLDDGKTWIKYAANPVIKNPGLRDFRDPKVIWYQPQKKWIMSLAVKDNVTFYSSPDLKSWVKESEFGAGRGAHGGGWECPDLFPLGDNGKQRWVLIVNLNPGAPNGGSGTQYFVGDFDGKTFTCDQKDTQWLDYGPDNYAGITWSNTGKRKIFLGWMSNWAYANQVPTEKWRNAMTLPRELKIKHAGSTVFIASEPVSELSLIQVKPIVTQNITVTKSTGVVPKAQKITFPCRINLSAAAVKDFSVILSNNAGEQLVVGYDELQNKYFIDRTKSGKTDFQKDFAAKHSAPRLTDNAALKISLIIDVSSIELFADDGLTVMTSVFFPNKPYNQIQVQSADGILFKKMEYMQLKSIW
jgi:fructan beta-fructosidase